jgi:hypothetical protein
MSSVSSKFFLSGRMQLLQFLLQQGCIVTTDATYT